MAATPTLETASSVDGTPIAFDRSGQGPPLLLVHGSTADRTRWEPVRSAFAEHFATAAMDRRGRGGSGDAAEHSLDREVEDVLAVIDAIDGPIHLIGHSYGAICTLEAARRTDDVGRLVLYEPPLPVSDRDPDSESILVGMESAIEAGERETALVRFFREIAGVPPAELDALRTAPNWPTRVDAVHTVVREERARKRYTFDPARFADLATPTVLLLGSETAPFLVDGTAALDDILPDSRIVVLEGQAHAAMDTAPDRFVAEVLAFLQETD